MKFVSISLKQGVGAPSTPVIKAGDKVKKGQLIADYTGMGSKIHSSVYGTIREITDTDIIIDCDELQPEEFVKIKDTDNNLDAINEAGIVGAGGAGFPAFIKYGSKVKDGYVIMNAAECEPILEHNMQDLIDNADAIVRGLKYLVEMSEAKEAYIAIKPKNKKALLAISNACKNEPKVSVKFLPDMYPAGDERVIIREILGIVLEPGQLPSVANAIVSNVETVKYIVEAIELRKPVITKSFTVAGRVKNGAKVFMDQPIGACIKDYIDECGGYVEPYGEIILGGPFTGKRGQETSTITKTLGGVIVAMPFVNDTNKFGILSCECGADANRLKELVSSMNGEIVAEEMCKRMTEVNGRFRCDKPGECPGQAEKILKLKAAGMESIIVSTCED